MIASFIIWIYILIFSHIYGWNIIELLRGIFKIEQDIESVSKPIIILIGMCGITIFAGVLSLFLNLGWLAQILFFLLGLFLGWRMLKKRGYLLRLNLSSIPWWLIVLFFLLFLAVLSLGSRGPTNPDTGIYHAQAIRWMETYPVVPGLGNLHSRLAYNSNWLVINAFFSLSFLGIRSFHVLPGAFLIVTLIYFLEGGYNLYKGHYSITNILKLLLIPLTFYILSSQISSPGTDFPADILLWVTSSLWLESFEIKKDNKSNLVTIEEILVLIFSIYLVTIKLSTLPVLLLGAFIILKYLRKNGIASAKLLLLAFLILAPWLARNLILSGYWVYPVPFIVNLSPNFDWKIPLPNVIQEARVIQAWARIPGADAESVLSMPLFNWLKVWFERLTSNQKILVFGALLSPFMYFLSTVTGLRKKTYFGYYSFTFLASYASLVFWLFEAPDIRFGYGFVVIAVLLTLVPLVYLILSKIYFRKVITYSFIFILILFQGMILFYSLDLKSLNSRVLLPTAYDTLSTSPCKIHDYTLACANWYNECWYDPFPCIPPGNANPQVELRGQSIRDGFRFITDH